MGKKTLYYETDRTNPYYNLAMEEYLFRTKKENETIVYLWQNEPTVVIGKFQNLLEEINMKTIVEKDIHVVRRNSGGGAVYHDLGNLNYTVIFDRDENSDLPIHHFLEIVTEAIGETGIKAEVSGRNDICVNGSKISGNSQYLADGKVLLHGTILIHSDLQVLNQVLTRSSKVIHSKATKSVKSKVMNLQSCYNGKLEVRVLQEILKGKFLGNQSVEPRTLTDDVKSQVQKLEQEKYRSHEWNYGNSPKCDAMYEGRFAGGTVRAYLNMKHCVIDAIRFEGDFICKKEIEELEQAFVGIAFDESLLERLKALHIEDYFVKISRSDIYHLFFA